MTSTASSLPTSATTGRALYVYYRVAPRHAQALLGAVRRMQAVLMQASPGLTARLMQRLDEPATEDQSPATWMEIYEHPDGVDETTETRLAALVDALPSGLVGDRHVEVFVAMPPPIDLEVQRRAP